MGYLTKTDKGFIKTHRNKGGFPKLLINIKDHELKELAEKTHPEVYDFKKTSFIPKKLRQWQDTINDIKVSQIKDDAPKKIGFEKVLGEKIIDPSKDVMMYGKNKQTLFAAAKRQVKTAPIPDKKIALDFQQWCHKTIEQDIGEDLNNFHYNVNQWYNHLSRGKQLSIDPIRLYFDDPVAFDEIYTIKDKEKFLSTDYEAIVKAELQPADGKPRMVCSIPQRIKYVMGPVAWQLEEICANKLNGYCGGQNLTEMSEKIGRAHV